jgi:ketosteroid isomerase-like protein
MKITIKSILTGLLFAASLQLSAQTVSETKNAETIRKLYEAVNTKDLNYIKGLGDKKSEWLDVPFNFTSKGENAIIDPWKSWFDIFPDARCEVKSLVSIGDYVVAQGVGTGTQKGVFNSPAGVLQPTGVSMNVNFCDVYRLKDGKILRADSYFDFYGLWKQLTSK